MDQPGRLEELQDVDQVEEQEAARTHHRLFELAPRQRSIEMPRIIRFFGIVIRMDFDEHPPPHFHWATPGRPPPRVAGSPPDGLLAFFGARW